MRRQGATDTQLHCRRRKPAEIVVTVRDGPSKQAVQKSDSILLLGGENKNFG
jgi:hypothetical protein